MKTKLLGLWSALKEYYASLKTLVTMQIKEKMDFSYLRSKRQTVFKVTWFFLGFAVVTALIAVLLHFVKLLGLFSLVKDIPTSVIAIVFSVMLALSVVTDTVGLMRALYFSRDNTVLLTLPAPPALVFFSKLAVYYIYELKKSFLFTIPLFVAYGIIKGLPIYYYPWLLLLFGFVSALPVLIAGVLSIPAMFISVFVNRFKWLQYTLYGTLALGLIVALWYAIGLIPKDIDFIATWGTTFWEIQDFLKAYMTNFALLYAFTELIVGRTVGLSSLIFHSRTFPYLLVLIGVLCVLLLLCFLLSRPLFYRMASTPFEFKKRTIEPKPNRVHTPLCSALVKELIGGLRSNSLLRLFGTVAVIMPIAIQLLNKLYSAMNTRFIGAQMTVSFNVLIMLLIVLSTNIDIASIYSRDGSSAYLNKIQPAGYAKLLISKLVLPAIITFFGVAYTTFIFARFTTFVSRPTLSLLEVVSLGLTVYFIYVAHLFYSAELDIMNPQYAQYATFNEQANNPNENLSGIMAILFAVIAFAVALFLSSMATKGVWLRLALITLVIAVAKCMTYLMKIRVFYKEKQA